MGNLKYKGYIGSVEYSEEDNILFGKVLGMSKDVITYEGETLEELTADFHEGVDHYLAACAANCIAPRKAYSGSLNIRISPETHGLLASIAQKLGTSINGVIKTAINDFTKHAL